MKQVKKKVRKKHPYVLIQVPVTFTGTVPVMLERYTGMKRLNKIAGEIALTKIKMHSSVMSITADGKWTTSKKFTP